MLWFALWALTPAGSNPAESRALGHQPWVSDPPCEEVGSNKLAGVEDSGPTVWYNFTLEGQHRDMQDSLSKRSLPKKLVSGTVSDDWRKWTGKVKRKHAEKSYWSFFYSVLVLFKAAVSMSIARKICRLLALGDSQLAGSKQREMGSRWKRVD